MLHFSVYRTRFVQSSVLVLLFGLGILVAPGAVAQTTRIPGEAMRKALETKLPTDPAQVVAVVGQTQILYGDLKSKVEARIKSVLSKVQQEIPEQQLHFARVNLTRSLLAQTIQTKRMRESFLLDQVSTQDAEKRAEASEEMNTRARQFFFDSEIPNLLKKYDVDDMTALDEKLREEGSSLPARQREFMDAMLGHLYMKSVVNQDPEVTIAEIFSYYRTHQDDYKHRAQARWEQLTVLFKNFPNRQAADVAIREMFKEAYFGGSMQAVARAKSQEPLASQGGVHDWTNQGSLASDVLDQQIFSLPLNQLSDVIEDSNGFHIVRVQDRKPAGVTPLKELQDEIREKLKQKKVKDAQKELVEKIEKMVPVWTIFPDDIPGSNPLPSVASAARTKTLR